MVNIQIMGRADIQLFVDAHTAQVIEYRHQQILDRKVTILAEEDNASFGERVFRQLIAQATGRRAAKRKKLFFPLTLQAQRLGQFALFIEQAIGFAFGAIDPVQFSHHLDDRRVRLQQ